MRSLIAALVGTALLSTAPAVARTRLSPEAELADAVKGRVAGEPVSCINMSNVRSVRIIDRTAIIYDAGRVIYVNRPRGGAEQLDKWDALVTRLHTQQLCQPDIVRLYDTVSRFETGAVSLGKFVPYRRTENAR